LILPEVEHFLGDSGPLLRVKLLSRRWLCRVISVATLRVEYRVTYVGFFRSFASEKSGYVDLDVSRVLRNGSWQPEPRHLGRIPTPLFLPGRSSGNLGSPLGFITRFHFEFLEAPATIDVRFWPWLTLRGFSFRVGGLLLYSEGCLRGEELPMTATGGLWDRELDDLGRWPQPSRQHDPDDQS
jgi:hypothetical protein